jgi:hypothetical protein
MAKLARMTPAMVALALNFSSLLMNMVLYIDMLKCTKQLKSDTYNCFQTGTIKACPSSSINSNLGVAEAMVSMSDSPSGPVYGGTQSHTTMNAITKKLRILAMFSGKTLA